MCGRYVLDDDGTIVAYVYGVPASRRNTFSRRCNIAPSQNAPIIRPDSEGRRRRYSCARGAKAETMFFAVILKSDY
jgi:putative SOS response-associated peptidase YedK